jgi:hypothetical protein
MMAGLDDRERRLRNLSRAVGILDEEVKRNKSRLCKNLYVTKNKYMIFIDNPL